MLRRSKSQSDHPKTVADKLRRQINRMSRFVVFVALLVVTAGCSSTYDPHRLLDESFAPTYLQLPGIVVDIEIEDARQDTTNRELRVPALSFPWSDDEVQPALTPAQREFIESEISKYFSGGDELSAKVVIMQGVKRFVANWFSEGEEVECELTIDLMREGVRLGGGSLVGAATIKVKSFDAGASTIDDMYLKVIAACIDQCMREYSTQAAQDREM